MKNNITPAAGWKKKSMANNMVYFSCKLMSKKYSYYTLWSYQNSAEHRQVHGAPVFCGTPVKNQCSRQTFFSCNKNKFQKQFFCPHIFHLGVVYLRGLYISIRVYVHSITFNVTVFHNLKYPWSKTIKTSLSNKETLNKILADWKFIFRISFAAEKRIPSFTFFLYFLYLIPRFFTRCEVFNFHIFTHYMSW